MNYHIENEQIPLPMAVDPGIMYIFANDAEWNDITMNPGLAQKLAAVVARIVPSDSTIKSAMMYAKHKKHDAMLIRNDGEWKILKYEDNYIAHEAIRVTPEGVNYLNKIEHWTELETWATQDEINELRALLGGEPLL